MSTLNPGVRQACENQMRERIRQDGDPVARDDRSAKQQEGKRRQQEYKPGNRIHEVHHRVEVAQALRKLQSPAEQRILDAKYLDHPPCPANPLSNMRRKTLCG